MANRYPILYRCYVAFCNFWAYESQYMAEMMEDHWLRRHRHLGPFQPPRVDNTPPPPPPPALPEEVSQESPGAAGSSGHLSQGGAGAVAAVSTR